MKVSLAGIALTLGLSAAAAVSLDRVPAGVRTAPLSNSADVVRTAGAAGQDALTGFDEGVPLSNRDLAEQSDAIVIGRATETQPFWIDNGRNLVTLVTIAVDETLKGDGSGALTVTLPGGVDANRKFPIAMSYPGAPRISPNEEVFLFLVRADDEVAQSYAVTGFSQGKFSIESAAGAGASLRVQGGEKNVRVGGALVPLSAFRDEIRGYLP
jgi:hypothetical protein